MAIEMNEQACKNHFMYLDPRIQKNVRKSFWVLAITIVMMISEIFFGHLTGSMALLADGWHMSTHALALGITYLTYRLATHPEMAKRFNFGGGKFLALGGFTSAVTLLAVFVLITKESIERLLNPESINFNEALFVAGIGLMVNLVSAVILHDHDHGHGHSHGHGASHDHGAHDHSHEHAHDHSHDHGDHDHQHHSKKPKRDHNIRAAYIHVIADAVTSVGAIGALFLGKFFGLNFLDPAIGIVGAIVILSWSVSLIRDTGWELLDGHARHINYSHLRRRIESAGAKIADLHVWNVSPNVVACELVVESAARHGLEFYRQILETEFSIQHSVIEERVTHRSP